MCSCGFRDITKALPPQTMFGFELSFDRRIPTDKECGGRTIERSWSGSFSEIAFGKLPEWQATECPWDQGLLLRMPGGEMQMRQPR